MPDAPLNLADAKDRARAKRELYRGDHGFLRVIFRNLHKLGDNMMRANQPSPAHLKRYADEGVKTILNLRGASPKGYYLLEKEACEALGLELIDYRVYSYEAPKKAAIHDLKRIFTDMDYPCVMHCKSGADRTSLVGTLYKHFEMGEPISEAIEQLRLRYLHISHGKTGIIDYFFDAFLTYEAAGGPLEFIDWVDEVYDPQALMTQYRSGDKSDALAGKVLRRE